MGRTGRCPDRCGSSGKLASFQIDRYISYAKPGEYGDAKQEKFNVLYEDNTKNLKVPEATRDAILALKPGDKVRLDWNHDYVRKAKSYTPERVIIKLEPLAAAPADEAKPLIGGYAKADVNDERVRKAAEFAVAQKSTKTEKLALIGIEDTRQQVVAGMNYKLTLKLTENGKEKKAEALVWLQLDGTMSLTSWEMK